MEFLSHCYIVPQVQEAEKYQNGRFFAFFVACLLTDYSTAVAYLQQGLAGHGPYHFNLVPCLAKDQFMYYRVELVVNLFSIHLSGRYL